jgi:hypothetical protein
MMLKIIAKVEQQPLFKKMVYSLKLILTLP